MTEKDDANAAYRADLLDALADGARRLRVTLAGDPVYGWRDRSVGSPAISDEGRLWLRVVREHREWADGEFWTGNSDAAGLPDAARRPLVVRATEWEDGQLQCRAELMTFVDANRCSPTPELRTPPRLEPQWWASLRSSLYALANVETKRVMADPAAIAHNLLVFFGVDIDLGFLRWSTAHGDLQWANLTEPECWLLDWEAWGTAPMGMDAANLYCHSLLTPQVATAVHDTFAELLDTPTGKIAQLYAATRMLRRIDDEDYPDFAVPLHKQARRLLAAFDYSSQP